MKSLAVRMPTRRGFRTRWDGRRITRRTRHKKLQLDDRRLAISILVQKDIAYRFLSDPKLSGQGILSRFLVAEPEPTIGKREISLDANSSAEDPALWFFHVKMRWLLRQPDRERAQPDRTIITFHPNAARAAREFLNSHDKRLGAGGDLFGHVELVNKIPEMACRIAGTLAGWHGEAEVSLEVMKQAIEVARFHLHETVRINKHERFDPDTAAAEEVLAWIHKHFPNGDPFSLVDAYLHGSADGPSGQGPLRSFKKKERLRVMDKLIDYRAVERVTDGSVVVSKFDGGRRKKDIYRLRGVAPALELEFEEAASSSEPSPASPAESTVKQADAELDAEVLAILES